MSQLERYLVDIPAVIFDQKSAAHAAKVLNISLRGAMLECPTISLSRGDAVQVKLSFEKVRTAVSEHSISLKDSFLEEVAENSIVRWTGSPNNYQLGIEFTNPKLDTLEFLARLIRAIS